MYCWQTPTHVLYSNSLTPRFGSQPDIVYTTPGLGHIVQDFALYVPLPRYSTNNVKEVEKQLYEPSTPGGLDLNPPLLSTTIKKKKSRTQKGDGNTTSDQQVAEDRQIEDALDHPIKVFVSNIHIFQYGVAIHAGFVDKRDRLSKVKRKKEKVG